MKMRTKLNRWAVYGSLFQGNFEAYTYIFKRLRATAGQGPNYAGPFCGILGLCWPILKAMWADLEAYVDPC